MEARSTTFRPRPGAWAWLLLPTAPIIGFSLYCLIEGALFEAAASLGFAAVIIGYNMTMRLTVTEDAITLRRYGRVLWSAPLQGTEISFGRGGDGNLLPAYVISRDGKQVGFLLKGWFSEDVIREVGLHLRT